MTSLFFTIFFKSNFWWVFAILAKLYTSLSFKDSARHGNCRVAAAASVAAAACERKASLDPLGLPPKQQQQAAKRPSQEEQGQARRGCEEDIMIISCCGSL